MPLLPRLPHTFYGTFFITTAEEFNSQKKNSGPLQKGDFVKVAEKLGFNVELAPSKHYNIDTPAGKRIAHNIEYYIELPDGWSYLKLDNPIDEMRFFPTEAYFLDEHGRKRVAIGKEGGPLIALPRLQIRISEGGSSGIFIVDTGLPENDKNGCIQLIQFEYPAPDQGEFFLTADGSIRKWSAESNHLHKKTYLHIESLFRKFCSPGCDSFAFWSDEPDFVHSQLENFIKAVKKEFPEGCIKFKWALPSGAQLADVQAFSKSCQEDYHPSYLQRHLN